MTATNKLKAKIVEQGLTQLAVAKYLGISYQAFSYKINNKTSFKVSEIESLCRLLNIDEKDEYFFCSQISQNG